MDTQVIRADRSGELRKIVLEAGRVLSSGGLLVFPTETVYGLAARADLPQAMARLREVKEREAQQGFTVHLASRDDARKYVTEMPSLAVRMIRKAWPGGMKRPKMPFTTMAQWDCVARTTLWHAGFWNKLTPR